MGSNDTDKLDLSDINDYVHIAGTNSSDGVSIKMLGRELDKTTQKYS
jgi:hypothetical protein